MYTELVAELREAGVFLDLLYMLSSCVHDIGDLIYMELHLCTIAEEHFFEGFNLLFALYHLFQGHDQSINQFNGLDLILGS